MTTPTVLLTVLLCSSGEPPASPDSFEATAPFIPPAVREGVRVRIWTADGTPRSGRVLAVDDGGFRMRMDGPLDEDRIPWTALRRIETSRGRIQPGEIVLSTVTGAVGAALVIGLSYVAPTFCIDCYEGGREDRSSAVKSGLIGGAAGLLVGLMAAQASEEWRGVSFGPNLRASVTGGDGVRGALTIRF